MASGTTEPVGRSKHLSSDSQSLQQGPLYSRPTIKLLLSHRIITEIGPNWYKLGITLLDEDQFSQLAVIRSNHNDDIDRCIALFVYWLEAHSEATWYQLAEALKSNGVELNNVAATVERIFPAVEPENNIAAVIVEAVTDEIEPLSAKYETEERFVMDNQEQNPKSESVEETQKKSLTDKQSEMAQPMILSKKHDVTTCAADSTSKTEGLKNMSFPADSTSGADTGSHTSSDDDATDSTLKESVSFPADSTSGADTGSHAPSRSDDDATGSKKSERICDAVSDFYEGQFREKWKDKTDSSTIHVLSALLMERKDEVNVVVLAAGTTKKKKCSYFLNKGNPDQKEYTWGLCDGHAPSVCYRLASLYLLTQIHKLCENQKSILNINCGYALKKGIKFHFFTTQLPCGFMAKEKHHYLSWKIPFKEKPHCLQCSSTILIGTYLGIQGPLSHLFSKPIYISSITIPKSKNVTAQDSVDINQCFKKFQARFNKGQITGCDYQLIIPHVEIADVESEVLFPKFFKSYDDESLPKIDKPLNEIEERHTAKEIKKTAGVVSDNRNIGSRITVFKLKDGIGDDEFCKKMESHMKNATKNVSPEELIIQVKQRNFKKLQDAQKSLTKALMVTEKPSEDPFEKLSSFIAERRDKRFYVTDCQNGDKVIVQLKEMEDCRLKMGKLTAQVNKLKDSYCTTTERLENNPSVQREITSSTSLTESVKQFKTDCELMIEDLDSLDKSMEDFKNGTKSIIDDLTDYLDYKETFDDLQKFLKDSGSSIHSCDSLFDLDLMGCDWARYMQSMRNDI